MRIEVKDLLSPLVLYINYKEKWADVKVIYSRKNKRPTEEDCEASISTPKSIIIQAIKNKHYFLKDTIYFKMQTYNGCNATLKVVFPNEDKTDERIRRK